VIFDIGGVLEVTPSTGWEPFWWKLDDTAVAQFMRDLWTEYLGSLNEPLLDYFTRLRPRYRTGILSNSFVGAREREQASYGFADRCDLVVYSHEEGLLKPDARFFRLACGRLGVDAQRCVFVDDTPGHVEAARAIGMEAITFQDNEQAISELGRLLLL
jgi:epoxide hydrolase-like predicted phosphatase